MAFTTRHMIALIKSGATSGSNPVDFRIPDSQILSWANQIRATLAAQDIQKRKDISDVLVQSITCMPVQMVDKSECCEITTDCYIMRTTSQLPPTIETTADNAVVRIEKPNGDIISKSNPFESKYAEYNKYTGEKPKWFIKNGYIYISNEELIPSINVWAIFEDPSDLAAFTSCNGSTCFSMTSNYPCSLKMASEITDIVLKKKVFPFLQMPQDNTNNANNNFDNNLPKNI